MHHTKKIYLLLLHVILVSICLSSSAQTQLTYLKKSNLESQESFEAYIINTLSKIQNRKEPKKSWTLVLEECSPVISPLSRYAQAGFKGILALLGAALEQLQEAQLHIAKTECPLLSDYVIPGTPALFVLLFYNSPQFRQKSLLVLRSALLVGASFGIAIAFLEDLLEYVKTPEQLTIA